MDTHPTPEVLFAARLTPNRSASVKAINLMIALLALVFFATGLGFMLIGAWPVMGFLGFEIVLLYLALRWNLLLAGRHETVTLTREALTIERTDPWGTCSTEALEAYWARVDLDTRRNRLEIRSRDKGLVIGRFLAPEERADFADALRAALAQARNATS
ncbi:MAG: DUF2244 domain-containing protein [Alphaproteobacteria bacterium]|nr:DUF2244 domain-containing protein [Alphaproteobacteria bacterium]MBM3732331.1 DUF2244 domain-containing protein [Acidimicrobiia bacterium]